MNFIKRGDTDDNQRVWKKPDFNFFYGCPSGDDLINISYRKAVDFKKMWLTIGSQKYPDLPYTSSNMAYYYLNDAIPSNAIESPDAYISSQFITLFNLERCNYMKNMMGCGLDTFNKAMTLSLEFINDVSRRPDFVHTVLENEMVIEINNTGITVLE